jgi:hypothetical protein
MCQVDLPMYLRRQFNRARGAPYREFSAGIKRLSDEWIVTTDIGDWNEEMLWMAGARVSAVNVFQLGRFLQATSALACGRHWQWHMYPTQALQQNRSFLNFPPLFFVRRKRGGRVPSRARQAELIRQTISAFWGGEFHPPKEHL